MAKATTPTKYSNFRDAYCALRRCPTKDFEIRVFRSTLMPLRLPLAIPFLIFQRRLFAMDFETIRGVGNASRRRDVATTLEEFSNYNRLDRSRRRILLGIRTSANRLMDLYIRYEPFIETVKTEKFIAPPPKPETARAHEPVVPPTATAVAVRRLKTVMAGLSTGRALPELLNEAGWSDSELMDLLASNEEGNPGFAWLRQQLTLQHRLVEAEREIQELQKSLARQSQELNRWHENRAVST